MVRSERLTMPDTEPQSFSQSQKITVSLFPADDAKITGIQLALGKLNRRASASQIVRLALRSLPVDDAGTITPIAGKALVKLFDAMGDEDGRSRRFSWENLPADSVPRKTKRRATHRAKKQEKAKS